MILREKKLGKITTSSAGPIVATICYAKKRSEPFQVVQWIEVNDIHPLFSIVRYSRSNNIAEKIKSKKRNEQRPNSFRNFENFRL